MNALTHTYYLKALDEYPYNLADFLEAINYALAYDENNADANYLMGRFYMEQLRKYDLARDHFETALASDINHIQTYYYFIRWAIDVGDFELATKLIQYAKTIQGVSKPDLLHRKGTIYEKMGQFKKAQKCYTKALKQTIFDNDVQFFKREKARVKNKMGK